MNLKIFSITLIVVVGFLSHVNGSSPAAVFIHQKALEELETQRIKSISKQNERSAIEECYPYYNQVLNELMEIYQEDIKECEADGKKKIDELKNEGEESRKETTETLNNVCGSFDTCKAKEENLDFFDCVNNSGRENTRYVWKSSTNSENTAKYMREQMHVITYETGNCTKSAEEIYVERTINATLDLVDCYNGGGVIPTNQPSTDVPTDSSSTEPPTTVAPPTEPPTTTDGPSTELPTTTDAPPSVPSSTDASSTEVPSTPPASTTADSNENDQVEELEQAKVRTKLENFMKSWGKI